LPDQLGFLVIALGCSVGLLFVAKLDLACLTGANASEVEQMHPPMAGLHAVGLVSAYEAGMELGENPSRLGQLGRVIGSPVGPLFTPWAI